MKPGKAGLARSVLENLKDWTRISVSRDLPPAGVIGAPGKVDQTANQGRLFYPPGRGHTTAGQSVPARAVYTKDGIFRTNRAAGRAGRP